MRRANAELAEDLDRGEERAGLTVEAEVHFGRGRHGRRQLRLGKTPEPAAVAERVPRIARTMALAIEMQRLVDEGVVADYAELARIAGVTRARITQIMSLVNLAPDIVERVLFAAGRDDGISERWLRRIALLEAFRQQRLRWATELDHSSRMLTSRV